MGNQEILNKLCNNYEEKFEKMAKRLRKESLQRNIQQMKEIQEKENMAKEMGLDEQIIASLKINWALALANQNITPTTSVKIGAKYTGKPNGISVTQLFDKFMEFLANRDWSYRDNKAYQALSNYLEGEAKLVYKYQKSIHKHEVSRVFGLLHITFEKRNTIIWSEQTFYGYRQSHKQTIDMYCLLKWQYMTAYIRSCKLYNSISTKKFNYKIKSKETIWRSFINGIRDPYLRKEVIKYDIKNISNNQSPCQI